MLEARTRPKPSSYSTRTPSIVTISRAPGNFASARSRSTTFAGSPSTHVDVELGRREARRQRVQHRARIGARAQDLEQARRRVGGVVEAVPALAEEDVAAHLAGERRAELLHLRLDERVAGLPHHRLAAGGADERRELLRALDVEQDRRAAVALEHVAREEHQLAVGIDDRAVFRDDAEPVAVAVEREADLGVAELHDTDQLGEVLGLARIGMVVREVAVDLRVHLVHGAAERAQDAGRRRARDAVAGVDGDRHRPLEPAVAHDARRVLGQDVHRGAAAASRQA